MEHFIICRLSRIQLSRAGHIWYLLQIFDISYVKKASVDSVLLRRFLLEKKSFGLSGL